uniref:F-box domain-containing protein n=1 Tax=viral metagenome TaxID=1070528 RepID=A0A6C0C794_9ZZZZ
MLSLFPQEILLLIGDTLTTYQKLIFSSISVSFDKLKYKFIYRHAIAAHKIQDLLYKENFAVSYYFVKRFINTPRFVKRLHFSDTFNSPLDNLPHSVTHLFLGRGFNKPLDLPPFLTHLYLGKAFNQEIDNLPSSLVHIKFGKRFNKPVANKLPPFLKHIEFNKDFNQPLNGFLPHTLQYIHTGGYNYPLDIFPESLIDLLFGYKFNQPIRNIPPVKRLCFTKKFNHQINNLIPSSVEILGFGKSFDQELSGNVPDSVDFLIYEGNPERIKNCNLRIKSLGWGSTSISSDCVPPSVRRLIFGTRYNLPIQSLPSFITKIQFGDHFNQPIDNILPENLISLKFGLNFNQPIDKCIPSSVTRLIFGEKFHQSIANMSRTNNDNLTHLTISSNVEEIITGDILPSIKYVVLHHNGPNNFNQFQPHVKVIIKRKK